MKWKEFTNEKQWKEYIQKLLKTNNAALLRAVVLIHDNQTLEEKILGRSCGRNKIGFSRWDSEEMSFIAEKIKSGKKLQPNEVIHSRIVMVKYWHQLMVISKQNLMLEIEKEIDEENQVKMLLKEKCNEYINQCFNEGIACGYGICEECLAFKAKSP